MKIHSLKFLFIGRIDPIKNLHLFLDFLIANHNNQDIIFRIIGPDYGGVGLLNLKSNIKVEILPACYDTLKKNDHFEWADYCVLLSDFEALSMFLLESLKIGKPIVTNEASWPLINFSDNVGVLVTNYTFETFEEIINKKNQFNKNNIMKFYQEKFSKKSIIDKIKVEFL